MGQFGQQPYPKTAKLDIAFILPTIEVKQDLNAGSSRKLLYHYQVVFLIRVSDFCRCSLRTSLEFSGRILCSAAASCTVVLLC